MEIRSVELTETLIVAIKTGAVRYNRGEQVGLPADLADDLIASGRARAITLPEPVAEAVELPVKHRMQRKPHTIKAQE